jgi:hypothetical protein
MFGTLGTYVVDFSTLQHMDHEPIINTIFWVR